MQTIVFLFSTKHVLCPQVSPIDRRLDWVWIGLVWKIQHEVLLQKTRGVHTIRRSQHGSGFVSSLMGTGRFTFDNKHTLRVLRLP